MKDELFDKKIKELSEGYQEPVDMELWGSIGSELARKRKALLLRRIVLYSAAAAAIVMGIFLFVPHSGTNPHQSGELKLAQIEQLVPELESHSEDNSDKSQKEAEHIVTQIQKGRLLAVAEEEFIVSDRQQDRDRDRDQEREQDSRQEDVSYGNTQQKEMKLDDSERVSVEEQADSEIGKESVMASVGESVELYENLSYGDEEYLIEDASPTRNRGDINISAWGNMSASGGESSYKITPGPSFNVGGGHGVKENHSITPTSVPYHHLPVSAGLNLSYSFLKGKLAVGLGLNYTYLFSKYDGLVDRRYNAYVEQSVHYIGIPLNLYYNIIGNEHIVFYANAGAMLERALNTDYDITTVSGEKIDRYIEPKSVQWSVNAGIGFEYRFVKFMGLYIEPRISYFFMDGTQPFTIRVEQPLQFNLELGLRFHL